MSENSTVLEELTNEIDKLINLSYNLNNTTKALKRFTSKYSLEKLSDFEIDYDSLTSSNGGLNRNYINQLLSKKEDLMNKSLQNRAAFDELNSASIYLQNLQITFKKITLNIEVLVEELQRGAY